MGKLPRLVESSARWHRREIARRRNQLLLLENEKKCTQAKIEKWGKRADLDIPIEGILTYHMLNNGWQSRRGNTDKKTYAGYMEKMRFGRKFSSFCAFSLIYYSASLSRRGRRRRREDMGERRMRVEWLFSRCFRRKNKWQDEWLRSWNSSIRYVPLYPDRKYFHRTKEGGTHQKRTVKREKKRENNTTTTTSNGFYVHIRYILCSCVAGAVLIFITAGWRGSFRQWILDGPAYKNNKRFHFVNESDSSLCVPLLSLFPSFCFFFSTRYRKNWTMLVNKIKKETWKITTTCKVLRRSSRTDETENDNPISSL